MASSLWSWWTSNTALHTYVYAQTLISLPFSVFTTYTSYQLQTTGFIIGSDGAGGPCQTFCIVEWAGTKLDLNAVILYMNAFGIGLSGFVTLFLSAYSDFWSRKHLLVTLLFIAYGVICIPVFWLRDASSHDFNVMSALSILFTIFTNILVAILNIYIPYCMRVDVAANMAPTRDGEQVASRKRTYGFKMAVFGAVANSAGALVMYIIVIIISRTTDVVQTPGLLVTTVVGFVTVVGSAVTYFGLPRIPAKPISTLKDGWTGPLIEFFRPFTDLLQRRSMAILLISYTIYTDTSYAIASVISQLYILEIRPSPLEISLYALTSTISGVICSVGFLAIRPHIPIRLETWLLMAYGLLLLNPAWGCIGFADVDFGFKERWEFYVQVFLLTLSGVIANTSFRVLFSEMVPPRNEVRWFGLQFILSSATVWVNYVASAPLQNATHQLRFPLILSLIFVACACVLEISRNVVPFFRRDQERWMAHDKEAADEDIQSRRSSIEGSSYRTMTGSVDKVGSVVVSPSEM